MVSERAIRYKEIVDKIKHDDGLRDHSLASVSTEERTEMMLYNNFKKDPYFKHYIFSNLANYSEKMSDAYISLYTQSKI